MDIKDFILNQKKFDIIHRNKATLFNLQNMFQICYPSSVAYRMQ